MDRSPRTRARSSRSEWSRTFLALARAPASAILLPVDVAALCPLPVGIVAWQSPGRVLTVIVKATFSLGMNGVVTLAPVQEPLSLDRPSRLGADDELEYASDFAPLKARADVVMVCLLYTSPSPRDS